MNAAELDRLHRDELVRFARRLLGDVHRAEDMVQEMLVRFAKQTKAINNPRAWAFQVVRNCCKNELRNNAHVEPLVGEPDDPDDPLAAFSQSEFQEAMADCIAALSTEQRAVLQHQLDGQKQTDIAKTLKRSDAHVSRLVTGYTSSLRDCLRGKGFVEQP
jgi:RNA polymerase sigma factor (sigma-70 family)